MKFLDRQPLYELLRQHGLNDWATKLEQQCTERLGPKGHGCMSDWLSAWDALPKAEGTEFCANANAVSVSGESVGGDGRPANNSTLRDTLMKFHPWRKGPFELFGQKIDTEWRSDWKWQRLAPHLNLAGKRVLDVGCGNGYYGWRMLDAGADLVLGCDPYLRYITQFEVLRKYFPEPERHFVVPLIDSELPRKLEWFDTTFSLGVLYHRSSPIEHLQLMAETLQLGGELFLETLIINGSAPHVLVPEDRYAMMKNVWFIPTVSMLEIWLRRTGFGEIEILDVSPTTPAEQRSTDWMTFRSLKDFLDPDDLSKTVEGHPAPLRAIMRAVRSK